MPGITASAWLASCAPRSPRGRASSDARFEGGAVDLAGGEQRERLDLLDPLRPLEPGHAPLLHPRAAPGKVERLRRDDERADALAEAVVGIADDDGVVHGRVGFEHALHLGGGDVLPAPDDDVLDAAGDGEEALLIEEPEVARAVPAARRERGRGRRVVDVADEDLRPAAPHFADLTRRPLSAVRRVADAQLHLAHGAAVGVA